jgi:hypothetical protein
MELSFDKNSNLSYIVADRQVKAEHNHPEQREEIDSSEMLVGVVYY